MGLRSAAVQRSAHLVVQSSWFPGPARPWRRVLALTLASGSIPRTATLQSHTPHILAFMFMAQGG